MSSVPSVTDAVNRAPPAGPTGIVPAGERPPGRRWVALVPAVVAGALMLTVALVRADRPVLSWDEVTTADVSQRSPGQIWHLLQNVDAVFGAYYFLMRWWTGLAGTSELALRLPSIVAMAAAVALAAELGRRLFGPLIGTATGLILCLVPNTSRYAAEARPYAFTCLFSVLAVLVLYQALGRPGRIRWAAYGVTVVLLGVSHLLALSTLIGHAAIVGIRRRDERYRRGIIAWGVTVAVALAVLLPLAVVGSGQQDTQLAWVDRLTLGGLEHAPGAIVGATTTAWLLVGLALVAAWRPADPAVHLRVLGLAPPATLIVISVVLSPVWVPRYLLITLTPLAMLAAVALAGRADGSAAPARSVRVTRLLTGLVLLACSAYPAQVTVRGDTAKNGPDYRGLTRVVQRHQEPGDAIVFEAGSRALRAGMEYYLRRGPQAPPRDVLQRRPAAQVGQLRAEEHPDAATRLTGVRRVWLVVGGVHRDPTTKEPALRPLLQRRYERLGRWHLNRGTVALYRLRS